MIFIQLTQQIRSLADMLSAINDEQYTARIPHLGNASIGEHTRHIIELMQCTIGGHDTGVVDYLNRQRDNRLQTDHLFAKNTLEQIETQISRPDRLLKIIVDQAGLAEATDVSSTYFREMVYITDHTIHHMALIKVALIDMQLDIVADDFGLAYSTLKYKAAQKLLIDSQTEQY